MAKRTVGSLVFAMSTNSRRFESGFKRASAAVARFGRGVLRVGKQVAKWTAGIVAAGLAIGTYLVKRQFAAIDALAKMSDQIGISTEALSSYQFAAEQTGTSAGALTTGIGRLNRMLGDARAGNRTAIAAFERLGISLADLRGMDTEQAFRRVADSISSMGSVAEKTAAAQELLGRSGRNMINFLDQGSAGFDEMRKQAERLGLTIDRKTAAKIEMANDAMNRLRKVMTGIARQTAPHFAAIVTMVSEKLESWATSGTGAASKVAAAFERSGEVIAKSMDMVRFAAMTAKAVLIRLQIIAQRAVTFAAEASNMLQSVGKIATTNPRQALAGVRDLFSGSDMAKGSRMVVEDLEKQLERLTKRSQEIFHGKEGSVLSAFEKFVVGFDKAASNIKKIADEKMSKPMNNSIKDMIGNMRSLIDTTKAVGAAFNDFSRKAVAEQVIGDAVGNIFSRIKSGVGNAQNFIRNAVSNIQIPDQVMRTEVSGGFRGADVSARAEMTETRNLNQERNRLLADIRNALAGGVPAG